MTRKNLRVILRVNVTRNDAQMRVDTDSVWKIEFVPYRGREGTEVTVIALRYLIFCQHHTSQQSTLGDFVLHDAILVAADAVHGFMAVLGDGDVALRLNERSERVNVFHLSNGYTSRHRFPFAMRQHCFTIQHSVCYRQRSVFLYISGFVKVGIFVNLQVDSSVWELVSCMPKRPGSAI